MTVRDLWYTTDRKTGLKARSKRHGVGSRWQVNYVDLDGKRTSATFDTREEADLFDAGVKIKKNNGTLISADKRDVKLEEIWEPWLDAKANLSSKTLKDYNSYWNARIKPTWGKRRISDIEDHQVIAWIASLTTMKGVPTGGDPTPLSGSAKKKIADMISSMLARAVKMKIIPSNPLDGTDKPQVGKSERRYLNIEEVDGLLFAAKNSAVKLMLEVLLKTGLRVGEAKGVKVKDLDVKRRRIYIRRDVDDLGNVDETKTRLHRDVPLSQMMALLLEEQAEGRDPESWLLPDEFGKVWTTARWRTIWANLLADAGLETTLKTHELRHTAVSMAIAGGADIYVVQRMCGHAKVTTTVDSYGHLWDHGLDEAAEAIERHLESERKRVASLQARRAQREKDSGVRHLRVVE